MRLKKKKDPKDSERSWEVYADGGEIWGKVGLSWGDGGIKNWRVLWWDVIWFLIDAQPRLIGLRWESDGCRAGLSPHHVYNDGPSLVNDLCENDGRCYRNLACWTEHTHCPPDCVWKPHLQSLWSPPVIMFSKPFWDQWHDWHFRYFILQFHLDLIWLNRGILKYWPCFLWYSTHSVERLGIKRNSRNWHSWGLNGEHEQ